MVFLWLSYGFPVVFLWFSNGFAMVCLWFSYGFPVVFPWFCYGFPMVFLCFSYVFPTVFLVIGSFRMVSARTPFPFHFHGLLVAPGPLRDPLGTPMGPP